MKKNRLLYEDYPNCSFEEMKKTILGMNKTVVAQWGYECAHRVLPLFEQVLPQEVRPQKTLESLQKWIHGSLSIPEARTIASATHTLARETADPVAKAVVRSIAQAISTAHARAHALGAAMYALTAVYLSCENENASSALLSEKKWQYDRFIVLAHENSVDSL
jgi:hypothetical protein